MPLTSSSLAVIAARGSSLFTIVACVDEALRNDATHLFFVLHDSGDSCNRHLVICHRALSVAAVSLYARALTRSFSVYTKRVTVPENKSESRISK